MFYTPPRDLYSGRLTFGIVIDNETFRDVYFQGFLSLGNQNFSTNVDSVRNERFFLENNPSGIGRRRGFGRLIPNPEFRHGRHFSLSLDDGRIKYKIWVGSAQIDRIFHDPYILKSQQFEGMLLLTQSVKFGSNRVPESSSEVIESVNSVQRPQKLVTQINELLLINRLVEMSRRIFVLRSINRYLTVEF